MVILLDDLDLQTANTAVNVDASDQQEFMWNVHDYLSQGSYSTVFTNAFVSYSLCCPSRATLLTGKYAHNHGVLGNGDRPGDVGGCPAFNDQSTLATWLNDPDQALPYRTGLFGKYLNAYGNDPPGPPDPPHPCNDPHYVPPGWTTWGALSGKWTQDQFGQWTVHNHGNPQAMYHYDITNTNGTIEENLGHENSPGNRRYQTHELSERAVQFIRVADPANAPFFLYVAPTAPHRESGSPTVCTDNLGPSQTITPYVGEKTLADGLALPQPPSFSEPDVADKPSWVRGLSVYDADPPGQVACSTTQYRDRLESLRAVDRLVAAIASEPVTNARQTVVFLTSDNGFYLGEHRAQQKELAYEEGIRVPLMVHDPRSLCVTNRQLPPYVVNTDLAPTILELAELDPLATEYDVDGRSLVPYLEPSLVADCASPPTPTPWRTAFLVEHWINASQSSYPTFFAIRTVTNELYLESSTAPGIPPTETEYYFDLDENFNGQQPDRYQLTDTVETCTTCANLASRLSALENCGKPTYPTCQSLEDD